MKSNLNIDEEAFEERIKIKDARSKRNGYIGTALFLIAFIIVFVYFVFGLMESFKLIIIVIFSSIVIAGFLYGAYTKHKILKNLESDGELN